MRRRIADTKWKRQRIMSRYTTEFSVDFIQGKQRPRFGLGHVHTPDDTRSAEEIIANAYKGASIREHRKVVFAPQHVPVAIQVDCYPKWTRNWRYELPQWLRDKLPFTKKPDADNCLKTVADGLNGIAYYDDSQIIAAHVYKHDMERGVREHMEVTVQFDLED